MANIISFGYATSVGQYRENNEDSLLTFFADVRNDNGRPAFGVFAVADGMGGHMNGEKASAIATETLLNDAIQHIYRPLFSNREGGYQLPVGEIIEDAIRTAHDQIRDQAPRAGTTITSVIIFGDMYHLAHVGDSRAYLIRDGNLEQISDDHTVLNRLVQSGTMSIEEAQRSPESNKIYRALGVIDAIEVDMIARRFRPNSSLLLCSDGLHGEVSDEEILSIIQAATSPQDACNNLVQRANDNGGHDNISVIMISCTEG